MHLSRVEENPETLEPLQATPGLEPNKHIMSFPKPEPLIVTTVPPCTGPRDGCIPSTLILASNKKLTGVSSSVGCTSASACILNGTCCPPMLACTRGASQLALYEPSNHVAGTDTIPNQQYTAVLAPCISMRWSEKCVQILVPPTTGPLLGLTDIINITGLTSSMAVPTSGSIELDRKNIMYMPSPILGSTQVTHELDTWFATASVCLPTTHLSLNDFWK